MNLTMEQKEIIRSGVIARIGSTDFAVWLAIQSYVDSEGQTFLSQRKIAELVGVSIPTVNKAVARLEDAGVIEREIVGKKRKKTVYSTPVNLLNREEEKQPMTATLFVKRFCELYLETYGVNYSPHWGRDCAMVKNKLIGTFTDEQLEAILVITFRDFQKKWSSRQFPRPTIGALTTFIGNQALAIWQEEQKKEQVIKEAETEDLSKFFKNQDF